MHRYVHTPVCTHLACPCAQLQADAPDSISHAASPAWSRTQSHLDPCPMIVLEALLQLILRGHGCCATLADGAATADAKAPPWSAIQQLDGGTQVTENNASTYASDYRVPLSRIASQYPKLAQVDLQETNAGCTDALSKPKGTPNIRWCHIITWVGMRLSAVAGDHLGSTVNSYSSR